MEDQALDRAPLWDNVETFDGRPWRGTVDILFGGYPCQPFSVAGKRKGADDPRHLWPHFARIIGECRPEWVFLENVANHINIGYREVRGELEELGYSVTEGLFTAAEVGAPHKRQRLFVLAHAERGGRRQSTGDPDPQGQSLCPPQRQEGASGSGSGSEDVVAPLAVADAACELHDRPGNAGREGGMNLLRCGRR
jgi:site-specific DNA-cytosine methylase